MSEELTSDVTTKMAVRWSRVPSYRVVVFVSGIMFIMPYLIIRQVIFGELLRDDPDLTSHVIRELSANEKPHVHARFSTLPYTLQTALSVDSQTGYLLGNRSNLSFRPYPDEVDLRIIVIVYNRAWSLQKCLASIERAEYLGERVSLHVWIDRENGTGKIPTATYQVAKAFKFSHGKYHIHVQTSHVGIQGQWTNTWRPRVGSPEVGLILEDDMSVSPYFWWWLRSVHGLFANRSDISGYGLSHPGIAHQTGMYLDIPLDYTIYLYKVICTWGFSPQVASWRKYQEWFYEKEQNKSFEPLVEGILPTQWFLGEKKNNQQRNLWELWHIYYTHNSRPPQYNLLLNTLHEGLLAVNRHETGLHDGGGGIPTEPLCVEWKDSYLNFTSDAPKFGYDGEIEV